MAKANCGPEVKKPKGKGKAALPANPVPKPPKGGKK